MADPNSLGVDGIKIPLFIGVRCKSCGTSYQIKRLIDTIEVPQTYCAFCGEQNIVARQEEGDYWLMLALDLGLPNNPQSSEVVKGMFEEWSPQTGDSIRFMDFARQWIIEARREAQESASSGESPPESGAPAEIA